MKYYLDNIEINVYCTRIPLQYLVNHTAKKLLESLHLSDDDLNNCKYLDLHFKCECDWNSSHFEYHKKFLKMKNGQVVKKMKMMTQKLLELKYVMAICFFFFLVPLKLMGMKKIIMQVLFYKKNQKPLTI